MDDTTMTPGDGQHPHIPGSSGSGEPRDRDTARIDENAEHNIAADGVGGDVGGGGGDVGGGGGDVGGGGVDGDQSTDGLTDGGDEGAPLGGDAATEDQLQADTAVERDALRGLDPDDTPV